MVSTNHGDFHGETQTLRPGSFSKGATQKKTARFTNHESFGIGKNPKALRTEGPSFRKSAWWCNVPILKNDGVRQWVSDDIPFLWNGKWIMFQTTNQIVRFSTARSGYWWPTFLWIQAVRSLWEAAKLQKTLRIAHKWWGWHRWHPMSLLKLQKWFLSVFYSIVWNIMFYERNHFL